MPNIKIPLSELTVARATTLWGLDPDDAVAKQMAKQNPEMDLAVLITYLTPNAAEQDKKIKLAGALLRTSILKDIEKKLKEQLIQGIEEEEIEKKHKNKLKFWLLAIAGAIFFGCEGFDGIAALMGMTSASVAVSLVVALAFSVFAVMVFWGFGLRQIAEHLGVKFKDAPGLVNEYVIQMDEIEGLLKTTDKILNEDSDISNNQLDDYEKLLKMTKQRLTYIKQEKVKLDEARNKKSVKALKTGLSIVTGIIFFSSGFFTGQAVALSIAGLFMAASATFPPILAAAAFLGVVAFLVYWYLERPGIENLIGRKLGLDDEKLEKLGTERTDETKAKIESLEHLVAVKKNRQQLREEKVENLELLEQRNTTINDLTQTLAAKSAEVEALEATIRQLREEKVVDLQLIDQQKTAISDLKQTLAAKSAEVDALEATVSTEQLANEQLAQEYDDAKAKLEESEASLTVALRGGLEPVMKSTGELKEAAPLIRSRNQAILSSNKAGLFQPVRQTSNTVTSHMISLGDDDYLGY